MWAGGIRERGLWVSDNIEPLVAAVVAALRVVLPELVQAIRAQPSDRPVEIIRPADAFPYCGLKPTAREELTAQGKFPKTIPLSERAVGYLAPELAAWQRERIAERDAKTATATAPDVSAINTPPLAMVKKRRLRSPNRKAEIAVPLADTGTQSVAQNGVGDKAKASRTP